jgi:hypothetical protein
LPPLLPQTSRPWDDASPSAHLRSAAAGRGSDHAGATEAFGVSRERVRQIEVRAFEKVQKAVKNRVATMQKIANDCRTVSLLAAIAESEVIIPHKPPTRPADPCRYW